MPGDSVIDALAVLRAWALPAGVTVERARRGTNNLTWIVHVPGVPSTLGRADNASATETAGVLGAGGAYVLRLYQNARDPAALASEHRLLAQLARLPLPFAVPAPIPAATGETLVPAAATSGAGGPALAALFPLIAGEHPSRGDPAVARLCGATLAELDAALAHLSTGAAGDGVAASHTTTYGDLDRIHPLVPDPWALPDTLPAPAEDAARLRRLIEEAVAAAPALYAALPRQIIHSDFGTSNVLVLGGRVSGVLDFEFAAPDLRAMDWAVGLLHSAFVGVPPARLWENLDAFGRGYAGHLRLLAAEARALPALLRLRRVVSLIHRAGRWRQGIASAGEVRENLEDTLDLDRWLRANEARLIERALSWQGPAKDGTRATRS